MQRLVEAGAAVDAKDGYGDTADGADLCLRGCDVGVKKCVWQWI